jgi:hypothetical protein
VQTIMAMALMLATSLANAAPLYFVCDGQTIVSVQDQLGRVQLNGVFKEMLTLTLDLRAKTVAVNDEGPTPILRMTEGELGFAPKGRSVSTVWSGLIKRISGEVHIVFEAASGELHSLSGACEPAQKLF